MGRRMRVYRLSAADRLAECGPNQHSSLGSGRFHCILDCHCILGGFFASPENGRPNWIDAVPAWTLALDSVAGMFYIAGIYCLVRKRASSILMLLAGTAVNGIACASQIAAFFQEYGSTGPAGELRSTYLAYASHLCVILLLWRGFGRQVGRANNDGHQD